MNLPVWDVGSTMILEERWHDLLWSAVPHRVISSSPLELVTYVPTGAIATRASNRGLPGTADLTRDERKLTALRTRDARVVEVPEAPDKLFIGRPDRWSRTNLGWHHDTGRFNGWYVNFELPATPTTHGLGTMDLVVDIWVDPDLTWHWKDRDDFQAVLTDHTFDPAIRDRIDAEAEQLLHELETRTGPFADHWLQFRPDPDWSIPVLPPSHAWGGAEWVLETGPRRTWISDHPGLRAPDSHHTPLPKIVKGSPG